MSTVTAPSTELEMARASAMRLRYLLWLRHGCDHSALYGDDGEMQCAICLLDFKRAPVAEIEDRWRFMSVKHLAAEGVEWAQIALDDLRKKGIGP